LEKNENIAENSSIKNTEQANISRQDFNDLKRKLDDVDKREIKDVKNLLE
jgi:hypothetical protein